MKKAILIFSLLISNHVFSQEEQKEEKTIDFSQNIKAYEKILVKKCKNFSNIEFEILEKKECLNIIEIGIKLKNKKALNLLSDSLNSGINIEKNEKLASKIRVD